LFDARMSRYAKPMRIFMNLAIRSHPESAGAALQHGPWRSVRALARGATRLEEFLSDNANCEQLAWAIVAFALGVAAWFVLPWRWQWQAGMALCAGGALAAAALLRPDGAWPYSRRALIVLPLMLAAGCGCVWAKSSLVGAPAIAHAMAPNFTALVLDREDKGAQGKVRLVLAMRERAGARAIKIRVSAPTAAVPAGAKVGALVHLRARLMPPAAPLVPGSYDFAQAAWFAGMSATGTALGPVQVVRPAPDALALAPVQAALTAHVHSKIAGSAGGIAAAFTSGDRGGIAPADETAMRDSGLTHLLSVSGLHVSAVIGGTYFVMLRLLALFPILALRLRLPLVAGVAGGVAGIGYTLMTGAEVPTVRSCLGALLVLLAVALGRQPLTLRLLGVAAMVVMVLWPEAVVGPSFQMSFGSVLAIVVLHQAAPVRAFLAPREEAWLVRFGRHATMLLLTGMVIELALMPITFFHFHRAGLYGSLANMVAIPLTTFVIMPLLAAGLTLDLAGWGAPVWWLCGQALQALLALARWTAARPGATTALPAMGQGLYGLFVGGLLWLALMRGRVRLWGVVPAAAAMLLLLGLRAPDIMIVGDGRQAAISATPQEGGGLLVLRATRSTYLRDALLEAAGMNVLGTRDGNGAGEGGPNTAASLSHSETLRPIADWQGAHCSPDFCRVTLPRNGRMWRLLLARGKGTPKEAELVAACAQVDIVLASTWLSNACRPRWIKIDEPLLYRSGGMTIDLATRQITSVGAQKGQHPWWRAPSRAANLESAY
jgi:competence protein ComEC